MPPNRPPAARPVPFVGLTGGIGAGKSAALQALAELGAAVLSTDAVVHELYSSDEVLRAVTERFNDPTVAPGGVVDRARVAELVFASPEDRQWLEGLLWPLVGARIVAWRESLDRQDPRPPAGVAEVPLLFEAGMEAAFDVTIAVVVDERVRAARAAARGHRAVDERTARQLSQAEKAARATYVVNNDGDLGKLRSELSTVLESISA